MAASRGSDEVADVLEDVALAGARGAGEGSAVQRVLVAFDGSPGAWAALRRGIDVAASQQATLTVVGVVVERTAAWMALSPMCLPYTSATMRRDAEREMSRHLAAARDEVPATVPVTTQLLHGRPAPALAALAEGGRYDLVVCGHRPAGRLRRRLRTSFTHALLSRCGTSVLAVRP